MDFPQVFFETLGVPLETNVPLREHAHFRIGGEADFFFRASSVLQLVEAVRLALRCRVPYYVIGAGTNLLFDDRGYRGLVIRNDVCGLAHLGKGRVEALSGTPLQDLVAFCTEGGLEGLEFLAGIPGTVGGAVFGNAGAFEDSIGSHLSEALLLTRSGEEMRVGKDYFSFSYRKSRLRESRELVLKAWFQLRRGDRTAIQARIRANLKAREKKHPPKDVPCAGSYFKNPLLPDGRRIPAASLLDQVGARTLSVGGAAVFAGHANFIVNRESATAKDVLSLAEQLKKRVGQKFRVELEEEVIFLPAEP